MSIQYPLTTSDDEIARLTRQAMFFRDDAAQLLERIGVAPGWSCLDLCCGPNGITDLLCERVTASGHVVGLDYDSEKLAAARHWADTQHLDNVTFIEGDAFADNSLPEASFDLAHCRFAASIMCNGEQLIDRLIALARPGGIVAAQECFTASWHCFPDHPAWRKARDTLRAMYAAIGADLELGPKLVQRFHNAGLTDISINTCVHASTSADPMIGHTVNTLLSARETIVALGLLSQDEVLNVATALQTHLALPGTVVVHFGVAQVWGQKRR